MLGDASGLAAHVAVGGCLAVDRGAEIETLHYGGRTEVEEGEQALGNLAVGEAGHAACAFGVDIKTYGLGATYGVGYLHEGFAGQAGGHYVLGDMTGGVGCRAVDFRRVFARERAAAMCAAAAVSVDNYFAAGEAGVAVGAADNKFAGGVDKQLHVVGYQRGHFGLEAAFNAGYEDVAHVVGYLALHVGVGLLLCEVARGGDKFVVLCRHYYRAHGYRTVVVVVFYRHLALGVGAQVCAGVAMRVDPCHLAALATNVGELMHDEVAEIEGERHESVGLVGGIAKHHALVARALSGGIGAFDAAVDVVALLVNSREDATGCRVELEFASVVAYLADDLSHDLGNVDVSFGFYFAGYDHLTGGDECLASYFRVGVVGEERIKDCVGNLVGNLVGMPLRY